MEQIEYYVHIPFCIRKCNYCDFLSFPCEQKLREAYVERLCREIESFDEKQEFEISTLFLGGGTPSILRPHEIEQIMKSIRKNHRFMDHAELTIECNPGTLSKEKLSCYRELGINRISMGVQSFCQEELTLLGRIHTVEDVYQNFALARECGFDNINLDLMSALPGQTTGQWMDTLTKAVELNPEHLSAYSLIIEEGTDFYSRYHNDEKKKEAGEEPELLPSEETEREIYHETKQFLNDYGYDRYEISNYAKPEKECRHNTGYWERKNYIGFGLGAASMVRNVRFSNVRDLQAYLKGADYIEVNHLQQQEQMEETMFLGLRMMKGVRKDRFLSEFGIPMKEIYGDVINKLVSQGLLIENSERIVLTENGLDLANYVCAEFLLET